MAKPRVSPKSKHRDERGLESPDKNYEVPLRQMQYRSYQHVIQIYHFRFHYLSVHAFRALLNRREHGYIDTLIGDNTVHNDSTPQEDRPPPHSIEAAYLPGIFPRRRQEYSGSALGFCTSNSKIEWMCFNRPIDDILNTWIWIVEEQALYSDHVVGPNDERRLFDLVANLLKGLKERRVKGANEEHKLWHTSLWKATLRPLKLELTWKNYGSELRKQYEANQLEAIRRADELRMQIEQGSDEDNDEDNGDQHQDSDDGSSAESGSEHSEDSDRSLDIPHKLLVEISRKKSAAAQGGSSGHPQRRNPTATLRAEYNPAKRPNTRKRQGRH